MQASGVCAEMYAGVPSQSVALSSVPLSCRLSAGFFRALLRGVVYAASCIQCGAGGQPRPCLLVSRNVMPALCASLESRLHMCVVWCSLAVLFP